MNHIEVKLIFEGHTEPMSVWMIEDAEQSTLGVEFRPVFMVGMLNEASLSLNNNNSREFGVLSLCGTNVHMSVAQVMQLHADMPQVRFMDRRQESMGGAA